jgi:YVTN family beta-propeller protein
MWTLPALLPGRKQRLSVGALVGCIVVAVTCGTAQASSSLLLHGRFGQVAVNTSSGSLTDLQLRNPDGSLPDQPLSGAPIGSLVVASDGTRYESRYGAPTGVVVRHGANGAVSGVTLDGITLGRSPVLPAATVGTNPDAVVFSPDGQTAYVTNYGSGTISPLDPASGTASTSIQVGGNPTGIVAAPDGKLFVDNASTNQVEEIDPSSGTILNRITVGSDPQFLAETPDGHTVMVPNEASNTVSVIDTATGTVSATITVGPSPVSVAVSPDGSRAYVTNSGSNTVTPIDLRTMTALSPITVGSAPYGAAVTPDGNTLLVSLNADHAVALIDTRTGSVSQRIDVGAYPQGGAVYGVAVAPGGSTAYVAEAATNTFSAPRSVIPVDLVSRRARAPLPQSAPSTFVFPGLHPDGVAVSPNGRVVLGTDWSGTSVSRFAVQQPAAYAPVTEDWTLSVDNASGSLRWTITQHWHGPFSGTQQADPTIPFAYGTVSTLWYQPNSLSSPGWNPSPNGKPFSDAFQQTIADRNAWAIYKLYSPFRFQSDLDLGVSGGYLTHYVSPYGALAAAGAQPRQGAAFSDQAGDTHTVTVTLSPADKYSTGYQLDTQIPDKGLQHALQDMYGSLLNGGAVADQKGYWLGNEASGILLAYETLDAGAALNAGVPSSGRISAQPYSFQQGFAGYVKAVFDSVSSTGALQFGFNGATGSDDDAGLYSVLGLYQYVLSTGDLGLFKRVEPAVERLLSLWTGRIASNGLVLSTAAEGKYYDVVSYGSAFYSTFINSLLYESLKDASDLEHALAEQANAAKNSSAAAAAQIASGRYGGEAEAVKNAINRVLWAPNSAHGPMYADWIDNDNGQSAFYFTGMAQYMPIVFGIASRQQAQAILSTADARLSQLASGFGYTGEGTLSALWPLPPAIIDYALWPFGVYMNGGMLLQDTYYEVMARAMSGDPGGAEQRISGFARGYESTGWWGDNGATISGAVSGGSGEPYLSDMEIVPASLVQGLLGVHETWDAMTLAPDLPPGWHHATATVNYRGSEYCVSVTVPQSTRRLGRCPQG